MPKMIFLSHALQTEWLSNTKIDWQTSLISYQLDISNSKFCSHLPGNCCNTADLRIIRRRWKYSQFCSKWTTIVAMDRGSQRNFHVLQLFIKYAGNRPLRLQISLSWIRGRLMDFFNDSAQHYYGATTCRSPVVNKSFSWEMKLTVSIPDFPSLNTVHAEWVKFSGSYGAYRQENAEIEYQPKLLPFQWSLFFWNNTRHRS